MRVIETSMDEDLALFSRYLWQQRVAHRIFEERGAQILEVADPARGSDVRAAYQAWHDGRLALREAPAATPATRPRPGWRAALAYPGLTTLIVMACVVFPFSLPVADGRISDLVAWLTIVDPRNAVLPSLGALLAEGQVWRWFTPMLLHFSVLHLAFNCAVTIELGRRLERRGGALGLWLVVLALSGVSNLGQYAFGGGPLFGGLSGVGYGLLGYILVMNRRFPEVSDWQLPTGIALGLLIFLVLFSTGVTEPFGLRVANAAHWGGLLAGAALALLWPTRPAAGGEPSGREGC